MSIEKRYVFVVEWFDTQSSVIKKFYFNYYLPHQEIEMVRSHPILVRSQEQEDLPEENKVPRNQSGRPAYRSRVHLLWTAAEGYRIWGGFHPQGN